MSDNENESWLRFSESILPHENRIIVKLWRLARAGWVEEDIGTLNVQFDDEDEFLEAVQAWCDFIERKYEGLDQTREYYLGEE